MLFRSIRFRNLLALALSGRAMVAGAVLLAVTHSYAYADIFANAASAPSVGNSNYGWVRGTPGSTYSGWNSFTDDSNPSLIVDSTPDINVVTPSTVAPTGNTGTPFGALATLTELTGTPFLTGSGNIYSPTTITQFTLAQPGDNLGALFNTRLVTVWRTQGNELDYASITLTGSGISSSLAPTAAQELSRVALGPGQGNAVEYLARWDIAGNSGNYQVNFAGADTSVSLDQLQIDTNVTAVPEPATLLSLGAVSLCGVGYRAVRKRSKKIAASA